MVEQIGIVVGIEGDDWVQVLTDRKNACGGCSSGRGDACRSCLAGAKMQIRVANHLGAQKGDVVRFALRSSDFFKGALMLYIMPVLVLMFGALTGAWIGGLIGWQQTSGAILGSAAGLAVAVYLLVRLDRGQWARRRLAPRMTAVWSSHRSVMSRAPNGRHACCG